MRTEQERAQFRSIVQSPQWQTVKEVAEQFCTKVKIEAVSRETEWETVRDALLAEGKSQGVRQFIQDLTNEATYGNE